MLMLRYFVFVGGALLGLLLLSNAVLPKLPADAVATAASEPPAIRIQSERKWPQRVVIDTSLPTVVPAETASRQPAAPKVADVPEQATARDAFAQLTTPEPVKPELKPHRKHRVARRQPGPRPVMMAQQRPFSFFASNSW
jgi:hypothetical protein